jgi:hypothetical protein
MPVESQEGRQIAAALAPRFDDDATAAQIAAAMVAIWHEIDAALTPILGQGGVAALYKRTLYLTGAAHPWLTLKRENLSTGVDLVALKVVLSQQSSAAAAAGGNAFLQTFHTLLASLVGPSLTERLLRSVWAKPSSGPPAQDASP